MKALAAFLAVSVVACSAPEAEQQNTANAAAPAATVSDDDAARSAATTDGEVLPLPKTTATPTKTLPAELTGVWTADKSGDCAAGNPLRIEIMPTRIRFHESVGTIERAVKTWPEGYGVDAQVTGEGETERRSFDLIPRPNGTLTRSEAPYPDITYTRCKAVS